MLVLKLSRGTRMWEKVSVRSKETVGWLDIWEERI